MSEDEKEKEFSAEVSREKLDAMTKPMKVRKKSFIDVLVDRASTSTADMIRYTIIPGMIDLAHDSASGILDGLFDRGRSTRTVVRRREDIMRRGGVRKSDEIKVDYNGITSRPTTRTISEVGRRNHDFSEIIFESRIEAQDALDRLRNRLDKYDSVSVADLYSIVGIDDNFKDNEWGWENLDGAYVKRYRRDFILDLPDTKPLS